MKPNKRSGKLPIPRLPENAIVPVRSLASSAFLFRCVFMQMAEGMPLDEILDERGDSPQLAERVIDAWCDHFEISDDEEHD